MRTADRAVEDQPGRADGPVEHLGDGDPGGLQGFEGGDLVRRTEPDRDGTLAVAGQRADRRPSVEGSRRTRSRAGTSAAGPASAPMPAKTPRAIRVNAPSPGSGAPSLNSGRDPEPRG